MPFPQGAAGPFVTNEEMVLRDQFAAAVMTGIWAGERDLSFSEAAESAYKQADAMLRQRRA